MQRYKYLTSTILCTLILNACGDQNSNNTMPSSTENPNPDVTSTSVVHSKEMAFPFQKLSSDNYDRISNKV
jgi:hypothetical protein